MTPALPPVPQRRPAPPWRTPLLLVGPVLLLHLWLVERFAPEGFGFGDAPPRIVRIDVAFVRELQPEAPPPAPAAPPLRRAAPRAVEPAASAAATDATPREPPLPETAAAPAPAPLSEPPALAEAPPPAASASATVDAAASAAAVATLASASSPASAAGAAGAPAFTWPPSTRLDYILTGNYSGPVEGQARVDWLMSAGRYQVHLELSVGPPFAPLVSRRLSSEGEVTPDGLVPRRYEEETKVAFREPRRVTVEFEPERVLLANGRIVPRPSGVQDSASQFVQMTWLFNTRAGLLAGGEKVEIPLALPRAVDLWIYDVVGAETLYTAAGELPTMHVKPRREARPGGDLTAEFWVAPTLQYLPVRIVIRQDADTWVDLMLERLPQQAAR